MGEKMTVKKISFKKALDIHKTLSEITGGDPGLRDEGLLDSALESPFQTFLGEELYPSVEEKAARRGYSLISNHAFIDGNKRIGVLAMLVFLELNGFKLCMVNDDVIKIGLEVASGGMKYDELLGFIKMHTEPVK